MEEGRKKYFNLSGGNQKLVPVGMWKQSLAHVPFAHIHKHTAVFLGHILKKQGVQYVISAMPAINKYIPDFRLLVMGGGEYLDTLKRQVRDLHIEHSVVCTGFITDHKVIEDKLSHCALGIALYDRNDNGKLNFSYFGSPTKVKVYLAAGLPVLMTDVPYNAREMEKEGCGKIITTDPEDIAKQMISILSRQTDLEAMRTNVIRYRKQFDWEDIFANALKDLI
jgi:glycosyltransferase involved in cell wall biosynthesis